MSGGMDDARRSGVRIRSAYPFLDVPMGPSIFEENIKEPQTKKTEGTKHDADKPPISLIPREFLEETARAFAYGANKYGRFNFTNGIAVSRCLDAAMRHITASVWGEKLDGESGHDHLAHAAASLAMALYMIKNKPEMDDRFKPADK